MRLLGTTKVAIQNKITLIEEVANMLQIKIGDRLAFLKNREDDIVIKNLAEIEITNKEE